jgi:aspartyl-tRNA(Asn)/glutamyl-tRNA(Gln) amidotransferase subunit A
VSWLAIQDAMLGCQLGAVARPFDDDLVRRVRQAVECTIAKDRIVEVDVRGERVPLRNYWTSFTSPFNHCGFPAASQPCGFDGKGLPIGLQIAGRAWDDATVLRAANTFEQATTWHRRRPDLE